MPRRSRPRVPRPPARQAQDGAHQRQHDADCQSDAGRDKMRERGRQSLLNQEQRAKLDMILSGTLHRLHALQAQVETMLAQMGVPAA